MLGRSQGRLRLSADSCQPFLASWGSEHDHGLQSTPRSYADHSEPVYNRLATDISLRRFHRTSCFRTIRPGWASLLDAPQPTGSMRDLRTPRSGRMVQEQIFSANSVRRHRHPTRSGACVGAFRGLLDGALSLWTRRTHSNKSLSESERDGGREAQAKRLTVHPIP